MTIHRKLAVIILLLVSCVCAAGKDYSNETLHYKVLFRWGLINKTAGHATLHMQSGRGNECHAQLTAYSEPWADRIYRLRDTLNATMLRADYSPLFYEKIAHEGNEFKHDIVRFTRNGDTYTGDCSRYVTKKGKVTKDETRVLTATGTTVDMLSSFYHMRNLPFNSWQKGHTTTINIFSGKQKEKLTFKYQGVENIEINGRNRPCYHITFIFTGKNQTKTSDDMDAWISADGTRTPLRLEGKLPVGKVQCVLVEP